MFDLASLNPQQRLAVETIHGPVLILAGAGTGKTRVITHRVAHMISRRIAPENILAVTFTNKAAREMQERVSSLIGAKKTRDQKRPTISTFHSLCVRILRNHIEKLGYKKNFVIYDESEQLGAVKKILSHISSKTDKADAIAVLQMISRLKSSGRKEMSGDDKNAAMARHILDRYQSALRACNAVDFDDLILLVLKLFKEHEDVLEACRETYKYVMVDEYQDTNSAQFELVNALTKKHRNFCVVGDDDQSIYGWRGADTANLLDLEKHYPEVKVIKLEQNYRSTTTILTAANAVIKNNARRRGKQLWSDKGNGAKIRMEAYESDDMEADEIVALIEYNRTMRKIPWSQNAILFRTNLQSRPLETALRKANVRYHLIGGQSFFDRREIKDFFAYLKTIINPHDDIALLRIANVPARGLSDASMEKLLHASHERGCSIFAVMRHSDVVEILGPKGKNAVAGFLQLLQDSKDELVNGEFTRLADWAEALMQTIGYYDELKRSEKNQEIAENRIRNIKELIATLDQASEIADLTERLESFLQDIMLESDREEEKETKADAVTLITTHSCKGLEFPHVYIVGMEEGLFPHSRSKIEGTLDEERRLFYVAITRAMEQLTISHCLGRKKYGQVTPAHPSQFLKELPEELLEPGESKDKVDVESGKGRFAALKASLMQPS